MTLSCKPLDHCWIQMKNPSGGFTKVYVRLSGVIKTRLDRDCGYRVSLVLRWLAVGDTDIKGPSFPWNRSGRDTASEDQGPGRGAIYTMVLESYWNVVQITICVFLALALVVCGYFGQHARGETGRRSVLGREWDDWEPQTSEIPHCRWSALCPQVYFSLPFLDSCVKKKVAHISSNVSSNVSMCLPSERSASQLHQHYLIHTLNFSN